jgi:putative phosphoesterase
LAGVFARNLTFGEFTYASDNVPTMKTIGVISDTHGVLRPEAVKALHGVDLIIHAGDVGRSDILDDLRQIAPVVAVRGNTDREEWARTLPYTEQVQVDQHLIFVLHDLYQLGLTPEVHGITAVISGHSHKPAIEHRRGVLYLNPGSAGPRRFHLPVSVALIRITAHGLEPKIVELKVADK